MAGAIRLTKAEREFITRAIGTCRDNKEEKLRTSIIAKLDKSEAPRGTGIDVKAAVATFEGVLGARLIKPIGAVWGMMQSRLRVLGLTEADCTRIATVAGADWAGRIKAESLVRQAEKMLSDTAAGPSTPRSKRGALDMEDL